MKLQKVGLTLLKDLGMRPCLNITSTSNKSRRYGLYKCGYCGKEFEARSDSIKTYNRVSCGCQNSSRTHGLSGHRLYYTWVNMVSRCGDKSHPEYLNYGARGIMVCDEWKDSPKQFIEDMFPSFVEGLSLARIDNDKGYSKDNCRWATNSTQGINRRKIKNTSSIFIGVCYKSRDKTYISCLSLNGKYIHIGSFNTEVEAVIARNNYIIENGLPHKLNNIEGEDLK